MWNRKKKEFIFDLIQPAIRSFGIFESVRAARTIVEISSDSLDRTLGLIAENAERSWRFLRTLFPHTMFGVRNEIYASCPTVMRPHARCPAI